MASIDLEAAARSFSRMRLRGGRMSRRGKGCLGEGVASRYACETAPRALHPKPAPVRLRFCFGRTEPSRTERKANMGKQTPVVLYVLVLAAVVVGVDVLFFRNRFWERLTVNIGIVLVFAAFYARFLKRP